MRLKASFISVIIYWFGCRGRLVKSTKCGLLAYLPRTPLSTTGHPGSTCEPQPYSLPTNQKSRRHTRTSTSIIQATNQKNEATTRAATSFSADQPKSRRKQQLHPSGDQSTSRHQPADHNHAASSAAEASTTSLFSWRHQEPSRYLPSNLRARAGW